MVEDYWRDGGGVMEGRVKASPDLQNNVQNGGISNKKVEGRFEEWWKDGG